MSINGIQVVTDNSVGDHDIDAGVIRYSGRIDGYDVRLVTSNTGSLGALTELRVRNRAATSEPLVVTISGLEPGFLTQKASFAASGAAGLLTPWIEWQGGGSSMTAEVTLTGSIGAETDFGKFGPAPEDSGLSQTITLSGLAGGKKVVVTAGSVFGTFEDGSDPVHMPAPPAVVLLALGVALVGAYQLRANQLRPRV